MENLMCADRIVPDVSRIVSLERAEILCDNLNSRAPNEIGVHELLRAVDDHRNWEARHTFSEMTGRDIRQVARWIYDINKDRKDFYKGKWTRNDD
jgi:hypothetical protein